LRFVALGHRGVTLTDVVAVHYNPAGGVREPDASTSGANIAVAFLDNPARCGGITEAGCASVATVSCDGVIVHSPVVVAAGGRSSPDTAWGEDRFGVLVDSLEPFGLHLALFAEAGELLGPPVPIRVVGLETVTGAGAGSALAWGRGGWAVAYLDGGRLTHDPANGIMRLDRDGRYVDLVAAGAFDCSPGGGIGHSMDLAFDSGGFGP
jgi:hypothetical protein